MPDDAMAENRAQYALSWTLLPPLQRSTRLCHECAGPAVWRSAERSSNFAARSPICAGRHRPLPRVPSPSIALPRKTPRRERRWAAGRATFGSRPIAVSYHLQAYPPAATALIITKRYQ